MLKKKNDFRGGQTQNFIDNWKLMTKDRTILQMIKGTRVELAMKPELDLCHSTKNHIPHDQVDRMDSEIKKLTSLNVIEETVHEAGEFISGIFGREKKDGSLRLILNLKGLNEFIAYKKFKMETLKNALTLISPMCYMASIDIYHAYFSVPIAPQDRKLLKFQWKGKLYQFTCYPNGLSQAPRNFTKLTKPIYGNLHSNGHISTGFLDDSLLIGRTKQMCTQNIKDTVNAFDRLGFVVHPEKSVFIPDRVITYLGFVINSTTMTITLTEERIQKIIQCCKKTQENSSITIRELACLIGQLVASFPGVMHGPLHYRALENDKIHSLKCHKGNWDRLVNLSPCSIEDIQWWIKTLPTTYGVINQQSPHLIISSDASLTGWGAICNTKRTNGYWTEQERQKFHINELELMGSFFALQSFAKEESNVHVRLLLDNTTAMHCINKMGSQKSPKLNKLTKDLWSWCIGRNIWVSAAYIQGHLNVEADQESRKDNVDGEWMLNPSLLKDALKVLQMQPDVDLFASRVNKQIKTYVSYKPDPHAIAIDAFSMNWYNYTFLAFPPFALVARALQKIQTDKATGIIIAPSWPNQTFYPVLMEMLIDRPVLLSARTNLLCLPSSPEQKHPHHKTLRMLVCKVSGNNTKVQAFQKKLQKSYCRRGDLTLERRMPSTSTSGDAMRLREMLIPLQHL